MKIKNAKELCSEIIENEYTVIENPCIKCITYPVCREIIISRIDIVKKELNRIPKDKSHIIIDNIPAYTIEHLIGFQVSEKLYEKCSLIHDYHKFFKGTYLYFVCHSPVSKDVIETFKLGHLLDEGYVYC